MDGYPFRFAFKSEFNSPAEVLVLWAIKNNISTAASCLTVDNIWFDRLLMYIRKQRGHKIDSCGAPKKTKQNKIRRCNSYTHFISFFLPEVINILHRI